MIKYFFLLGSLLLSHAIASAQTYQQRLQTTLTTDYGLPSGSVVTNPNEAGVLAEAITYGVTREDFTVQGQIFNNVLQITSPTQLGQGYNHAASIRNEQAIAVGDRLLFVCYVRADSTTAQQNVMQIKAEERGGTYQNYGGGIVFVSDEWQQILIPFEAPLDIPVGQLQVPFQIGFLTQTIEIAGPILFNYETAVDLSDLPEKRAPTVYAGQAPGAPWRAQANVQIDQYRKADLTVFVKDQNENPLPNQEVSVRMLQHEYGFGSAVVSCFVDGLRCADPTYESKMRDIDGAGHRFSEVVFENDLKWPSWENHWYETNQGVAQALAFYRDTLGMDVRGHTLLWPCANNVPDDVRTNISDTTYVLGRIRDHMTDILTFPGIAGQIQDWDLLNEVAVCNSVADAFAGQSGYSTGREFYPGLFRLAKSIDPLAEYWYNDYQVIQQGGFSPDRRQTFFERAKELLDGGAPLAGVGLQSHVSYPIPPVRITELLDEVYDSLGVPIKITEFDMRGFANEQVEGDYMRDFLMATFAHPSTEAFLTWGFWDGAHYAQHAPFFRRDWSVRPSGQAFFDLVFKEWWTEVTLTTDENGVAKVRGFKGEYEIEVGGEVQEANLLDALQVDFEVSISGTTDVSLSLKPEVRPNPTKQRWTIENLTPNSTVKLFDMTGRVVAYAKTNQAGEVSLNAHDLVKGVYIAKVGGLSVRLMKQ